MNHKHRSSILVLFALLFLLLVPSVVSASGEITFHKPLHTDVAVAGSSFTATWTWNSDPGPLNFFVTDASGFTKQIIVNNISKSSGQTNFSFTVKVQDYDYYTWYKIVARTATGDHFVAQSAQFRINPPALDVTAPAAGFVWAAGSTATIKWTSSTPTGTAKIELVRDNAVVQVITPSVPIAVGSATWTMPTNFPASYDNDDFIIRVWNLTAGTWGDSAPFKLDLTPAVEPRMVAGNFFFHTTTENKHAYTVATLSVLSSTGKKIAWGVHPSIEFPPGSTFIMPVLFDPAAKKSDFANARVMVGAKASGNDLWTFNGTLTLTFSDGTQITKQSSYERVMNSQNSQSFEVDLQGPAMAKPATTTTTPPAQPPSGKVNVILTHPSQNTSNSPVYGYNYYTGGCPYVANPNAKITSVKNTSAVPFKLWFTDKNGKKSPEVVLAPGESSDAFDGLSPAVGGKWEAAMGAALPSVASLEVSWAAP